MPLVTRTAKGSPLTTAEMDGNLTFLKARSRPYANVAAMQADTDLQVGDLAQTVGYYSAGDGGGATYEIVSADTVIGYDEPNIQAYNFIPSIYLKAPFTGNWMRINVAAVGSGSLSGALTAPDGTLSADFIAETSATGVHYVQLNQTMGAANSVPSFPAAPTEFVCYVAKYNAGDPKMRPYCHLGFALGSNYGLAVNQATSIIDLSSGTVTASTFGNSLTPAKTVVVDAGAYWLVKMQVTPATVGQCYWQMGASNSPTANSYAGSDPAVQPKGVYVWGWAIRPLITPGILLNNARQAKPLLNNTVRLSQFGVMANTDNNALLKALSYFGTNPGTLIVDAPTVFTQPSSLSTLTIPSNVDLKFEGPGALAGVTNMTVNSQLFADNRAVLPKTTAVTFSSRQSSVKSNWFGL